MTPPQDVAPESIGQAVIPDRCCPFPGAFIAADKDYCKHKCHQRLNPASAQPAVPPEGRLLTIERIQHLDSGTSVSLAQDAKTAAYMQAKVDAAKGERDEVLAELKDANQVVLEKDRALEATGVDLHDLMGSAEDLATRSHAAQATIKRLENLLKLVLPEVFVCPCCGPYAKIDEDACCTTCGADTEVISADAALAAAKETQDG